jgi:hypothetical protein
MVDAHFLELIDPCDQMTHEASKSIELLRQARSGRDEARGGMYQAQGDHALGPSPAMH